MKTQIKEVHTPTPWKIYRCSYVDETGERDKRACGFGDESLDWSRDECHHPLSLADAELIIRAVNSHEALLKASKEVLSGCEKSLLFNPKFLEKLKHAIAQAEGEK